MNQSTKTRTVYTNDNKAIGEIEMTDRQFAKCVAVGAMSFADLMSLGCEYTASDIVTLDTMVYVE